MGSARLCPGPICRGRLASKMRRAPRSGDVEDQSADPQLRALGHTQGYHAWDGRYHAQESRARAGDRRPICLLPE
jgi:hypothetical protein